MDAAYVGTYTNGNKSTHRSRYTGMALELSGKRTKKAAVNKALREFIARREQKDILQLFGKLELAPRRLA